jgi:hypothetical protein
MSDTPLDYVALQMEFDELLKRFPNQQVARKIQDFAARAMKQQIAGEGPTEVGWRIYTLEDAYEPRPPTEYVVEGLFPLPSLSIAFGAPGTLKSMALVDMGVCVAAGMPWLPPLSGPDGPPAFKTSQVPVLWCDFDNGTRRTHERIEAVGRALNLKPDIPFSYISMPNPWLDLSSPNMTGFLLDLINRLGAKLVVIDNLGVVSGKADENSAQMAEVMARCRRIAEEAGAALILVHHQRKKNGIDGSLGETLRGHSSIAAAVDLALLVQRKKRADIITMRGTKERGNQVPPFCAMFTYEHRPGTKELAKVRFFGCSAKDDAGAIGIDRAILEALSGETTALKTEDLKKRVHARLGGVGLNRIGDRIKFLASQDKLASSNGKGRAVLYSLPASEQ